MKLLDGEELERRVLEAMRALESGEDPARVRERFWNHLCVELDRFVSCMVRQPMLMQRLAFQEEEREDCKQYVFLKFRPALDKFLTFRAKHEKAQFVPWVRMYVKHRIIDFRKSHHAYLRAPAHHEQGVQTGPSSEVPLPVSEQDEQSGPWVNFVTHLEDGCGGAECSHLRKVENVSRVRIMLTNHAVHLDPDEQKALWAWMNDVSKQTPMVRRVLRRLRFHYRNRDDSKKTCDES